MAKHIEHELQHGLWQSCAVYENELQRLWPLETPYREARIEAFAIKNDYAPFSTERPRRQKTWRESAKRLLRPFSPVGTVNLGSASTDWPASSPWVRAVGGTSDLPNENSVQHPVPRFAKYCSDTELALKNCGSPTLRSGKALDFSRPLGLFEPLTWPATLQIVLKNHAKSSSS